MSQGLQTLSTFDTVHLGVFFSFRAEKSTARKLMFFSFMEKDPSCDFFLKNLLGP